jgi:hypothetical protein
MVGCPHNVHYNLPCDPMMIIEPAHHTAMPLTYQEPGKTKGKSRKKNNKRLAGGLGRLKLLANVH